MHDYEADVEVDSIEEVSFGDPEIIAIEGNQATIEVERDITFTADVSYEDPDPGVWDSEDRRMLFMDTVRRSVQSTAYAAVVLFEYESLAALANPDDAGRLGDARCPIDDDHAQSQHRYADRKHTLPARSAILR